MSILLPTFKNQLLFTSTIQIEEPSSSHDNNEDLIKPAKQFHFWSTLGIAYSFTSTPLAVGTYLSLTVGIGGSPFFIFAYLLSVCMNMCICLSLAELAAVMPHCGGQIFWTAKLAPKPKARGLSYLVGWLTSAGYFCWIAGTLLITSQLIIALICVCKTTFTTQPWHYYLTYMIIGIFTVMINVPLFKYYPSIYRSIAIYINIAALFLVITFLARTHPKQRAQFVFLDIVNSTGWDSNAVVFFLCLLPGVTAVNGFDSIAHMAEEMPDPRKQVPQIMILAAILSSITGFIMILVYMFCITNTENLTTPIGGQPIAQLMLDSFDSLALTIIGLLLIIICFIFACCSIMTTFSRVWWSLARDGGVPFSGTMSRVGRRSLVPANAVYFCFVSCALIGLLVFASTTALNAILAAGILFIFSSYLIPLTCLLIDRRRRLKEPHHFDFGSLWGTALNAISVVWICFVFVWVCFPVYIPVTGTTMNFAIVVFFIVLFISSINWFCYSAKHFTTPKPMGVSVALVMIC